MAFKKKNEDEEAVVRAPSFLTPPSGQSAEEEETFISMKDIPDLVEMVALGDKPSASNPFFTIKSAPILTQSTLGSEGNVTPSAPKMDLSAALNKLELKMDILSQRMPSEQQSVPESPPVVATPPSGKEVVPVKSDGNSPPLLDLITDIKDILASALDKPEERGGFVPIPNRGAMLARVKKAQQPPNLNNPFIALEVSSSNATPIPKVTPSSSPPQQSPTPLPPINPPPNVNPPQASSPPSISDSKPTLPSTPAPEPTLPPIIAAPPTPSPVDPFADIFTNTAPAQPVSTIVPTSPAIPIQSYFSSDMLAQFQANEINIDWSLAEIDQKIQEVTFQRQGIQEMLDGLTDAFMNQRIALEQYSEQESQATGYINKMNEQLQLLQELRKIKGVL